ncbi:bifunctional adenosylcobinamide kinase/adenosylcobinamide-phosphate guanylyltransferase [Sporosarcina sp. HYO08]|uniref:bifunctional adenosylcobinamide kinase/adenosylcobinamide-phosphate guanylyltransferase n=1 Tax=Sporosarcina sp. HYO08 TaxID=1759557 RepID=UPI0007963EC1|nr:bifunctional adenosylcobinamide kinase/adenosylcobinamide-phosphate guanylyltransferase [Sporosarcina sp. HYO08]KXH83948.1 hypothetical protein AU377_04125 [Sporosarcina sp. HYO08]
MHVYIGGAHNGKRQYVKNRLIESGNKTSYWMSGIELFETFRADNIPRGTIVVYDVEKGIAQTDLSEEELLKKASGVMKHPDVIFILTDIGRGIVPMEAEQRELRDRCGRLYQMLMSQADDVTQIWYGLAKSLKKRGEIQ